MEIMEKLTTFMRQSCDCGKIHTVDIKNVLSFSGAINKIPQLVKDFSAQKVFVLSDVNTHAVAGQKVIKLLEDAGVKYVSYVFSDKNLEPDEKTVGSAIMHYDSSCDLIIAVGSGVINDTGKILASVANKPYFIVATAPSMDGYASSTSSMARDGLKITLNSKCADVIIGDTQILKEAPMIMLQSGLGDMLAKYVSIAEWQIAKELIGEYYCPRIADLIKSAVKECVDNARGLIERDEKAVKAVFDGLVLGGVAMAFAGVSRPASGCEHYISHVIDMRGLEFKTPVSLHGIQCGIATAYIAGLYERLQKITPDKNRALEYVNNFDLIGWESDLKEFMGSASTTMIDLEKKEKKYDKQSHFKRIDLIIKKWDKIIDIVKTIPKKEQIENILKTIKAPYTFEQINANVDMNKTLKASKDIRFKYVLSHLLWDLGVIDEF